MIISQLIVLKNKSGLNNKQISERSTVPYSTVQKIFKEEIQSPSIDHIFKIVTAMGYTMNDLYDAPGASNKEEASIALIREMYEHRIAELKEQHAQHIKDVKENSDDRVKTYRKAIGIMVVVMAILFILFLAYFMIDYSTEHWGIFFNL